MITDNIDFSMQLLVELRDKKLPFLHISDKDFHNYFVAINDAISALKTIEDGNYQLKTHLNSVYGKMCYEDTDSTPQIDLKTMYEQATMYCELIDQYPIRSYEVEVWHQTDTPINVYVYWNKEHCKIFEIIYKIKGE